MEISGLGYYPNLLSPDQEQGRVAAQHLKRVISAAKMLNLSVVSTFVGRDWTRSIADNWPRFLSVWNDLIAYAEDQGIRIAIENCPMLFTADEWPGGKNLAASPAIWRRMFEDIPSPNFGLNYDPSHQIWQQMDHVAPLREFASRIFRVHLKDVAVDRQRLDQVGILAYPLEFHSPKLPGRGDIDWASFLARSKTRATTDRCVWKWRTGSLKPIWSIENKLSPSARNTCARCWTWQRDQYMIQPPSTLSVCPVMASLNSVERNRHTRATSSGTMRRLRLCTCQEGIRLLPGHELAFSLGFNRARSDAVDANVMFPHLSCQSAGKANNGALRCDVVG